jgi:hypothetical protein
MTFGLSASESKTNPDIVRYRPWQLHPCRCPAPTQTVLVAGTKSPYIGQCALLVADSSMPAAVISLIEPKRWLRHAIFQRQGLWTHIANTLSAIPLLYCGTCRLSLLHIANSCCFFWVSAPAAYASHVSVPLKYAPGHCPAPWAACPAPLPSSGQSPACYTACTSST